MIRALNWLTTKDAAAADDDKLPPSKRLCFSCSEKPLLGISSGSTSSAFQLLLAAETSFTMDLVTERDHAYNKCLIRGTNSHIFRWLQHEEIDIVSDSGIYNGSGMRGLNLYTDRCSRIFPDGVDGHSGIVISVPDRKQFSIWCRSYGPAMDRSKLKHLFWFYKLSDEYNTANLTDKQRRDIQTGRSFSEYLLEERKKLQPGVNRVTLPLYGEYFNKVPMNTAVEQPDRTIWTPLIKYTEYAITASKDGRILYTRLTPLNDASQPRIEFNKRLREPCTERADFLQREGEEHNVHGIKMLKVSSSSSLTTYANVAPLPPQDVALSACPRCECVVHNALELKFNDKDVPPLHQEAGA